MVVCQVSFLLFGPVYFSSVSDSYFYPFSRLCLPFYITFPSVSYIIPIILDSPEKTYLVISDTNVPDGNVPRERDNRTTNCGSFPPHVSYPQSNRSRAVTVVIERAAIANTPNRGLTGRPPQSKSVVGFWNLPIHNRFPRRIN